MSVTAESMSDGSQLLRPHAEQVYADELAALAAADDRARPPSWKMSPHAVVTYLLGGELPDGTVITPKYVGPRRLVQWLSSAASWLVATELAGRNAFLNPPHPTATVAK